jgi:hypothetical protein
VIAFLVNFSLAGSAIAGDTPAATGEVVVVVSLIKESLRKAGTHEQIRI